MGTATGICLKQKIIFKSKWDVPSATANKQRFHCRQRYDMPVTLSLKEKQASPPSKKDVSHFAQLKLLLTDASSAEFCLWYSYLWFVTPFALCGWVKQWGFWAFLGEVGFCMSLVILTKLHIRPIYKNIRGIFPSHWNKHVCEFICL